MSGFSICLLRLNLLLRLLLALLELERNLVRLEGLTEPLSQVVELLGHGHERIVVLHALVLVRQLVLLRHQRASSVGIAG